MDPSIPYRVSVLNHLPVEEKWNVYTHFFGFLLSLIGSGWVFFHLDLDGFRVAFGVFLYGLSLVALFGASTIYHAVYREYQAFWQKVDHIAIYFLIAGSYTPVGLTVLYNFSGVYLLIAVWGLALVGLLYKLFFIHHWPRFSLFLYLAMGWLVVFEFNSVQESFSEAAMNNLIIGGILYTTGVLFYRWHQWQWHHVVWHLFVLGGAFFHYLMVVEILSQMNYL